MGSEWNGNAAVIFPLARSATLRTRRAGRSGWPAPDPQWRPSWRRPPALSSWLGSDRRPTSRNGDSPLPLRSGPLVCRIGPALLEMCSCALCGGVGRQRIIPLTAVSSHCHPFTVQAPLMPSLHALRADLRPTLRAYLLRVRWIASKRQAAHWQPHRHKLAPARREHRSGGYRIPAAMSLTIRH
jgi:hypothetical protein